MSKKHTYRSRKRFGKTAKAWINIEIALDGRKAFLRELCFGGDASVGREDIFKALEEYYHISAGIDEDVVDRVANQAKAAPEKEFFSRDEVVIAAETQPEPPQDGRIRYPFLASDPEQTRLPYPEMQSAFRRTTLAGVLERNLRVRAVVPGEELAVLEPPQKGIPGLDIFGNIITRVPPAPERAHLGAGAHVRVEDNRYVSEIYGYVCLLDTQILVVPPLWISPKAFEAYFIYFPQVGPNVLPQKDWLEHLLDLMEISGEVSPETVGQLHRYMGDQQGRTGGFLLAQGTAPVSGDDAYLEYRFGLEKGTGEMLPDGSVDIEARKAAVGVKSGQLVAEVVLPTPGQPGANLKGEEIPGQDGRMLPFKAGKNVHVEFEGEHPRFFYSKFDGNVHVDNAVVGVHPVLRIGGDVDDKTGHIDVDHDVEISGSVRAGLKVNAGGSITIGGVVETGASVRAKGDIVVAQGIMGPETKIVALGHVETKCIQESSVMARRSILVGDHIFKGYVHAGDQLTVRAGSGSIVGGETYATTTLEAETVGASDGPHTLVGIGLDIEIEARVKKREARADFCNTNILRIFRTLNVRSLDPEILEAVLQRTPLSRRQAIVGLLSKLRELVAHREAAVKSQQELRGQSTQILQTAEIRVHRMAHADVQVRIGDHIRTIAQDLEQPVFYLCPEGVTWRLSNNGPDQKDKDQRDENAS